MTISEEKAQKIVDLLERIAHAAETVAKKADPNFHPKVPSGAFIDPGVHRPQR